MASKKAVRLESQGCVQTAYRPGAVESSGGVDVSKDVLCIKQTKKMQLVWYYRETWKCDEPCAASPSTGSANSSSSSIFAVNLELSLCRRAASVAAYTPSSRFFALNERFTFDRVDFAMLVTIQLARSISL